MTFCKKEFKGLSVNFKNLKTFDLIKKDKKKPRRKARNLMFAQRNNPYCDLLHCKYNKF